jgi:hypothetical protein
MPLTINPLEYLMDMSLKTHSRTQVCYSGLRRRYWQWFILVFHPSHPILGTIN